MTTLALNSFSRSCAQAPRFRKRWLHQSFARQAIMMPSMSPFMTEGTITRWAKKEGETFQAGDILLQIESDVANAIVDVKAEAAGVLGRILLPEGSTNVPVEQVIALVSQSPPENLKEIKVLVGLDVPDVPTPPPFNPLPSPPSRTISSPTHTPTFNQPFLSPTLRSPHFHDPAYHAHHRTMSTRPPSSRASDLTIVPPSPLRTVYPASARTASTQASSSLDSPVTPTSAAVEKDMMDGASLRRMIVSNLTRGPSGTPNDSQKQKKCDAKAYFDGIL